MPEDFRQLATRQQQYHMISFDAFLMLFTIAAASSPHAA